MSISSLIKNPFYTLGAVSTDGRQKLRRLHHLKAISSQGTDVEEAFSILTNPGKRLIAELRWFVGHGNEIMLAEKIIAISGKKEQLKLEELNDLTAGINQNVAINIVSSLLTKISKHDLLSTLKSLSWLLEDLSPEQICDVIDNSRE